MYRDLSASIDEHDRAVGAILIAETLVAQCEQGVARIRDPHAPERWRAMRDLHDDFPEIWRQLDRARDELRARGANTAGYEELRPHVRPSLAVAHEEQGSALDPDALDDVRRAIGELKLAVPGADWKAIARRTTALVDLPRLHRRHRLAVSGVVGALALSVVTWMLAIAPAKKPDKVAAMRREIAEIAMQRKFKIEALAAAAGGRCDAPLAHEYVKLLVMDGRGPDAEAFADGYTSRCGEDSVVENWANAPRPPR